MRGHCHGSNCRFNWFREDHDHEVFTLVTKTTLSFNSREEYDAACARIYRGEKSAQGVQNADQDSPPG
jgi:hypothetical protein